LLGYSYGRRVGSKIAQANSKEGDGVGGGSGYRAGSEGVKTQAIFEPNLLPYRYPNNSQI